MSKLTIDGFLLCLLAGAACNSEPAFPGSTTSDPFTGKWSCSDQLAITFTSPDGVPMQNKTQTSIMNITGTGGMLTATKEKEGGTDCPIAFTSNGGAGTLTPGQTCMTEQGITLTYTSGTATVNGSAFNSTFNFEGAGKLTISGMMVDATVTGTQTTTCSRLSEPTGGTGSGPTTGGW
jgi:hypothetical protein